MKKEYLKPKMKKLSIGMTQIVCLSVDGGGTGIIGGGGGSGPAHAPKWGNIWDDEMDWNQEDTPNTDQSEVW